MSVQAPPSGPPVTKNIWATPESRVPAQPSALSPATNERPLLRTRIKTVIREVTPPALYKAAHWLRQRRASKPAAKASLAAIPVSRATAIPDRPNLAYRHALALEPSEINRVRTMAKVDGQPETGLSPGSASTHFFPLQIFPKSIGNLGVGASLAPVA